MTSDASAPLHEAIIRGLPVYDGSKSLLDGDLFQISYVTNDLEKALEVFAERFDVKTFRVMESPLPGGGHISTRTVWIGAKMFEIGHATGPGTEFHRAGLSEDGFMMKLHHFGLLVRDEAAWAALEAEIVRKGLPIGMRAERPGYVKALYVTLPEMGHHLEFILPGPGYLEVMNQTPHA